MTLKEKFKQWLDTKPREQIRDVQLEVIADDYAIEFAEWIDDFYFQGDEKNQYHLSIKRLREGEYFNVKELLVIFKKEKGL